MPRLPVALTGTPGTGKTTVARRLAARHRVVEVGELALAVGAGRRRGRSVEVDLLRLRAALRGRRAYRELDLVVGHLAHLLPVRSAIVLRCRPIELGQRLRKGRRGTAADRTANYVAEATDVVLHEADARRLPVVEIDTTGRTPAAVARAVARALNGRSSRRRPRVDWLSDPRVTAHLLDGPR